MEIHNILCLILEASLDEVLTIGWANEKWKLLCVELNLIVKVDELIEGQFLIFIFAEEALVTEL